MKFIIYKEKRRTSSAIDQAATNTIIDKNDQNALIDVISSKIQILPPSEKSTSGPTTPQTTQADSSLNKLFKKKSTNDSLEFTI